MGDELDELLGGPRVWCGFQFFEGLNRKDLNPPILLYNNDVFTNTPPSSPAPAPRTSGGATRDVAYSSRATRMWAFWHIPSTAAAQASQ